MMPTSDIPDEPSETADEPRRDTEPESGLPMLEELLSKRKQKLQYMMPSQSKLEWNKSELISVLPLNLNFVR